MQEQAILPINPTMVFFSWSKSSFQLSPIYLKHLEKQETANAGIWCIKQSGGTH